MLEKYIYKFVQQYKILKLPMSNNSITSTSISSKLTKTLTNKTIYIHKILSKIGCPLIPLSLTPSTQSDMNLFYQATDSRLQLIQWLIASIYPGYKLDIQYKNIYHDDPHQHKLKKLSLILWKLGVMPMSKFTKSLDYNKYVQGLLGQQSAINLIYDLAQLADTKFSPNIDKIQNIAADLLGDLIKNNVQLVNVEYDPYGVTFPGKYYKSIEDLTKVNEQYNKIVQQLKIFKQKQQNTNNLNSNIQQTNKLFEDLQTYKQLFSRKYQKLSISIQKLLQKYKNIIPTNDNKEIKQLHQHRMLNMSRNLCKSYGGYKKMINQIKVQQFKGNVQDIEREIVGYIRGLNQIEGLL